MTELQTSQQAFQGSVLPGGTRVVTEEIPGSRSVALGVWVATGSRAEKKVIGGSAHFTEHMLFKGTPTRSASVLAREIDSIGGHLDAFTSREYTCYYLHILVEHVERGMEILADIVLRSTFPPDEVERERNVILEEIRMSDDTPDDAVYEELTRNIWPRSSLGRPILGTEVTIGALPRKDLLDFYRRHYRPSNFVFAAAGGVSHRRLASLWRKYFQLRKRAYRPSRPGRPRFQRGFFCRERELEQVHLCYGTEGLAQNDKERHVLYVFNSIFGGSMSSRLFQEVREKRGLAYSVYSSHSAYRDTGLFTVSIGTGPETARRVVDLVVKEMTKISARPPSAREIACAKDHIKGNIILGLESNGNRMTSLAKQEIYFRRHFGIEETIRGVEAVTAEQVLALAGKLFRSDRAAWSAVGPGRSLHQLSARLS